MKNRLSFQDEIKSNKIKSGLLMVGIVVVFIVLGYLISFAVDPGYFFIIMIIAIVFSLSYTLISYYNADKIAIASVKAVKARMDEHSKFINAAENMSIASGLPRPKLYVMESKEINAFASGRDPKNSVICVTTGAIEKLDKQELEGVIAHEMSHIANYDIRFITLATVMIGLIAIMGEIFLRSLWFGGGRDRDSKAGVIILVLAIVFAILAPLIANLIALAISRKREFSADATGVKFTRYPVGLKNALKKIKNEHVDAKELKKYSKAMAPLFISDPFKRKVKGLFSTHPDVDERIRRLDRM